MEVHMLGHCGAKAARVRIGVALMMALILALAAGVTSAEAKIVVIGGKRYGVTPKPDVLTPPSSLGTGSPLTVGGSQPPLQYFGGDVMLSSKLYLIFWGPSGSFASTYSGPIVQWAKDLQADQGKTTDQASVAEQYYQGSTPKKFITGHVTYGGALFDTTPYPALDTANGCTAAHKPCVSDSQIQNEIVKDISAKGWPTDLANAPVTQYLFYTPKGTSSCIDAGSGDCSFDSNGYCAYHFQVTGLAGGHVATYSNLPYEAECDSGQAPAGTDSNADTDGTLDSAIHEVVESMTDPDGNEWLDSGGNEVADKCAWGFVSFADAYGTPLGGVESARTAFNQSINTHTYFTQMIWSNQATATPSSTAAAGCVARMGPSPSFNAPTATQQTGTQLAFNGASSSEVLRPIASRLWNYGDGSPNTTATSGGHTYYKAGTYLVSLTVADSTGTTNASTERQTLTVTGPTLAPTISSFSPSTGIAGTAAVKIIGTNLQGAAVNFGAVAAPTTSTSGTQITVTAPNGVASGKITVTTDGGTTTSATAFSPTLSVSSFSPAGGAPGTAVTIHGVGFNSSSAVSFHGMPAASVTHTSSTVLTATVPPSATGGPITVTNTTAPAGHTSSRTPFTVS
jgi:hypothetical protein